MQRPLNRVNACTARVACTVRPYAFATVKFIFSNWDACLRRAFLCDLAIGGKATLSRQGLIVRFGRSTVNEPSLAAKSERVESPRINRARISRLFGDSVETRAEEAATSRSLLFVDLFRVARFRMAVAVQLDLPGKARAKVTEERETRSPFDAAVSPGYRAALLSAVYTKYLIKRSDETRSRITNTDREKSRG